MRVLEAASSSVQPFSLRPRLKYWPSDSPMLFPIDLFDLATMEVVEPMDETGGLRAHGPIGIQGLRLGKSALRFGNISLLHIQPP